MRPVWTEMVCRQCATTSNGLFSFDGKIKIRLLKKMNPSWLFSYDDVFCCEKCKMDYIKENNLSHEGD